MGGVATKSKSGQYDPAGQFAFGVEHTLGVGDWGGGGRGIKV
jgi:hypothetical protein